LVESAITTNRSAAAATIFSRVCAPPPPLTSLGARRRGRADDVERSTGQGREQERHRRAGAEPDGHAVFDQFRCRLRGDLLLPLDAPRIGQSLAFVVHVAP
jgi:hypothetical protein